LRFKGRRSRSPGTKMLKSFYRSSPKVDRFASKQTNRRTDGRGAILYAAPKDGRIIMIHSGCTDTPLEWYDTIRYETIESLT